MKPHEQKIIDRLEKFVSDNEKKPKYADLPQEIYDELESYKTGCELMVSLVTLVKRYHSIDREALLDSPCFKRCERVIEILRGQGLCP